MKESFTCSICHTVFEKKSKANTCEKKGNPKFTIGQKIIVTGDSGKEEEWTIIAMHVKLEESEHVFIYDLERKTEHAVEKETDILEFVLFAPSQWKSREFFK